MFLNRDFIIVYYVYDLVCASDNIWDMWMDAAFLIVGRM